MSHSESASIPYKMLLVATVCFIETFLETLTNRFTKRHLRVLQEMSVRWFRWNRPN